MNPEMNRSMESEISKSGFAARHQAFIERMGNPTYDVLAEKLNPAEARGFLTVLVGPGYLDDQAARLEGREE